jgi:hypothetical protein
MQNKTDDVEEVVVLKQNEDREIISRFADYFKVAIPATLSSALDSFDANPTIFTQNEVKLEIAKWIAGTEEGQDPFWKDDMWKVVVEKCAEAKYELQFEHDVQEVLGEDKKE